MKRLLAAVAAMLFLSLIPLTATAEVLVTPSIGATGSNGLGQENNGALVLGTTTGFHLGDTWLETTGTFENVHKAAGSGYRLVGVALVEYPLLHWHIGYDNTPAWFYLVGGLEGIHSDGGVYTKDTADFQAGLAWARRFGGLNVIKVSTLYTHDFTDINNPFEANVWSLRSSARLDIIDNRKVGLRTEITYDGVRYRILPGDIPHRGYRFTIAFSPIFGHHSQ